MASTKKYDELSSVNSDEEIFITQNKFKESQTETLVSSTSEICESQIVTDEDNKVTQSNEKVESKRLIENGDKDIIQIVSTKKRLIKPIYERDNNFITCSGKIIGFSQCFEETEHTRKDSNNIIEMEKDHVIDNLIYNLEGSSSTQKI